MNLWLVSNIRVEPPGGLKASALQNLRTSAALSAAGHSVLLWCDRIAPGGDDWAASQLGRPFPETLQIKQATARGSEGEKRSAFAALPDRVRNLSRGLMATGRPDAIITRSPSVIRQLRGSRLRPRGTLLILELQYPEWSFLWRDWARRHSKAPLHRAVEKLRRLKVLERRGYEAADGILYAARSHEALLDRSGYRGPRRWIPSASDSPEGTIAQDPAEFDVGYVGSLAPENGLESLLEAVSKVDSVRMLILGGGKASYVRDLEGMVDRLGISRRVEFAGRRSPGEVRSWMRRCRVGVVPLSAKCGPEKRQYASPLKLIEWMSAGVPVAASAVPSILQHQAEGEPIALFQPDRPDSIASCLRELLNDDAKTRRMAQDGLKCSARRSFEARAAIVTGFIEGIRTGAGGHAS